MTLSLLCAKPVALIDSDELRRHRKSLMHVVRRHVREPWMAEDILQETLARYVHQRRAIPIRNAGGWLRSVAMNLIRDQARTNRAYQLDELTEDIVDHEEPADEVVIHLERVRLFAAALAQLPPLRREVFIRRKLNGESAKEVADQLSISVQSVDQHVARALTALQNDVARRSRSGGS